MPNIGALLREEIGRVSRRTTKVFYTSLKIDVAELRHVVVEQRRAIEGLKRDNARLLADLNARIAKLPEVPQEEVQKVRISPRLILAQRNRLGLSQEEFGKLLRVGAHTVSLWEHAKVAPRPRVKPVLAAIRKLGRREARQRLEAMELVGRRG
jgi:DNA-binding transcriptional regulator YiaG